ncbi:unnamed protein product [Schistocephalus solidus]|uniref:Transposase n=1 Tax=Schistocephalus solidus TaxID=70667 RepID=A0A183SP88_SCHSO|nr:unnamed protein product [Schistocephalus solidus]
MAKNTTCPTPTLSVATSDYLPPATSNTNATPRTAMGTREFLPVAGCYNAFGQDFVGHLPVKRLREFLPVAGCYNAFGQDFVGHLLVKRLRYLLSGMELTIVS